MWAQRSPWGADLTGHVSLAQGARLRSTPGGVPFGLCCGPRLQPPSSSLIPCGHPLPAQGFQTWPLPLLEALPPSTPLQSPTPDSLWEWDPSAGPSWGACGGPRVWVRWGKVWPACDPGQGVLGCWEPGQASGLQPLDLGGGGGDPSPKPVSAPLCVHSGVGQAPGPGPRPRRYLPSTAGHHPGYHEPVCELLPRSCQVSPHPPARPPTPTRAVPREGRSVGPALTSRSLQWQPGPGWWRGQDERQGPVR